jgi:leader peptidase (prepilin peptidase)/N-methyltransferase
MEALVVLLGLVVGGLVNILADSLPRRRQPTLPYCLACTAPRPFSAWFGLGALLGRAWRCPYCDTQRGWRAPVVEVATGLGTLWLYLRDPNPRSFWSGMIIASLFLLIFIIDLEHRLILHIVSVPSAVIVGVIGILDPAQGWLKTVLGGVAGYGLVLVLYFLGGVFGALIAKRRGSPLEEVAFGFGDVMLAGVIGFAVGWPGVVVALFLGILAAGEYSLAYILSMLVRRRYQALQPIPYGPFLICGAAIVYFGRGAAIEGLFPYGPLIYFGVLILFFGGQAVYEHLSAR